MKPEDRRTQKTVTETSEEHFLQGVFYYDKGLDARNANEDGADTFFKEAFGCFVQAAEMDNVHAQN